MAFFKNIKKSFGFSNAEDDEYDDIIESSNDKKNTNSDIEPSHKFEVNIADKQHSEERLKKMQLEIFNGVVSIFNESLPDFLKSSLDVDAQKKYIFDSLDVSLRNYIENVGNEAKQTCDLQWSADRRRLQTEIDAIKNKCRELEESKEENQKQLLSAERQKRALSTRVHDLENQVTAFEAEKEQYELENRSLINKLKVSNVNDNDNAILREEVARLKKALKEYNDGQDISNIIKQKDDEINRLKEQLDSNSAENTAEVGEKRQSLSKKIESLSNENASLLKKIEQLKVKEEMSDAMINDLTSKASSAMKQLEDCQQQLSELSNKNDLTDSNELNRLKAQIDDLTTQLEQKEQELQETQKGLQMIEQIQEDMTRFEDVKKRKDAKISELQNEIKLQQARVAELEGDIDSLKSTIENNLYNQALSEDVLKKEIEKLKASLEEKNATNEQPKTEKRKRKIKISAIDESITDAGWMLSTPPEGTNTRPTPSTTDADFGYQDPPKKNTPNNDAQMLLW